MHPERVIGALVLAIVLSVTAGATQATHISGTWDFSVDVEGTPGKPTFVFTQSGGKLTGTVTQRQRDQKITGTIEGNQAVFGFEAMRSGEAFTATYRGTIESPTKMTGTVEFSGSVSGTGTWVAAKK